MSSPAPRRSPAPSQSHALIAHASPGAIVARRGDREVDAARFLADVRRTAAAMPPARHVLNSCSDRYRFAVVLYAAIVRGQVTLLPPTTTPNVIRSMRDFAPDAYCASDGPATDIDLPRFVPPGDEPPLAEPFEIPAARSDQVVACVFTSGSTGEPQPNFKTWGGLVLDIREEAERLAVGPGHTILGTVPPQHMYGFESTVLLPLLTGAAMTAERLYFPADINMALERAAAPRTLFTTPFHLRAWLESGDAARLETIVSATAPLSVGLARDAEERTGARVLEIYGCTEAGQVATRRPTESPEWHAFEGLRLWSEGDRTRVDGGHVEQPTTLMDVIEVLGDGTRFLLHGRTADLVNIAGKRNSIGYLNHQLTSIPGVADGTFYLPDDDEAPDGVTRLMAFAVAPSLDAERILAELRQRIDAAFLPRPLVLVDRLPRQLTGKLPRGELRALAARARKGRARGS
jgi:acyl-coenzyme A synthetase/AMP-(fatty) acid ligase